MLHRFQGLVAVTMTAKRNFYNDLSVFGVGKWATNVQYSVP